MNSIEPCVVLVLPLDVPNAREEVKNALSTAENMLLSSHSAQDVIPLIRRLHRAAKTLNYATKRMAAAIFISHAVEKVFYMDMKVERQVIIDEPFRVRDLARCSRKDNEFIVLTLNGKQSRLYHGYEHPLRLEKAHRDGSIYDWLNEVPEKTANFCDPGARHEVMMDKFLHHVDQDLGEVLSSAPLPVFVFGTDRINGHFAALTRHTGHIADYINKDFPEGAEQQLLDALSGALVRLEAVRQRIAITQIESAVDAGTLEDGLDQVRNAADNSNTRLLVFEQDEPGRFYKENSIDEVAEKVLANGGEIKEVGKGALNDFHHIALIRYY